MSKILAKGKFSKLCKRLVIAKIVQYLQSLTEDYDSYPVLTDWRNLFVIGASPLPPWETHWKLLE